MNEEENQEQGQEQNQDSLAKQVGKEALNKGKQMVGDAAKKAGKEVLKKAVIAVAQALASLISAILPALLAVVAAGLVLAAAKWIVDLVTVQKSSEQTQAILEEYCTVDNTGIHFDKKALKDNILTILEEDIGIDVNDLKLAEVNAQTGEINEEKASEYLYDFFTSSMASELPYIEGSDKEARGIIKIKRRNENGDIKDLQYIGYEKFVEMLQSEDRAERENSKNYFSIDESWNLCVSKSYRAIENNVEQTYTVTEVKIPYRTMVSQYAVPFEFLIALQSVTYNTEYVQSVANMISQNSEIELTIFDSKTTTTNTEIYRHSIMKKWLEEHNIYNQETGELIHTWYTPERSGPDRQEDQVTVRIIEEESLKANITKAKIWVIDQVTPYELETPEPEYPLGEEGNTVEIADEPEPPGEEGRWKVDQSETTITRIDKKEWVKSGDTKTNIEPNQFLGLWKNSKGRFIEYYNADGSINPDAQYNPDGIVVSYPLMGDGEDDRAVMNILSSEDWLCSLLEENMRTQTHAELMRYLIHFYKTGEKLQIDLSIFNPSEFNSVSSMSTGSGNVHETKYTLEEFLEIVNRTVPPVGKEAGYNKYFKAYAEDFYNIATSYGLNPEFIFAIGIHESDWGTSRIIQDKNNAFGYGAVDGSAYASAWTFASMREGIEQECKDLANNFLNPSSWKYQRIVANGYDPNSIDGIGSLYASDGGWARKVKQHMQTIFGYLDTGVIVTGGDATAVVELAKSKLGCPYVWGAEGPDEFDCSGLVQWVFRNAVNVELPRTANDQAASLANNEVSFAEAKPGDIVWRSGHIGIYIGNNQYLHAPHTGDVVKISNNASSQFTKVFRVMF